MSQLGGDLHCGSLFSHQELAIASFLELDVLAFQEQGVTPLDGMLGHLQVNAVPFSDRFVLPGLIEANIAKAGWKNNWRNQLVLGQSDPPYDRPMMACGQLGFFFRIVARNRHARLTARNCYGYLRSATDASTSGRVPFEVAEFKWAGYTFPNATIPPDSYRRLDALWLDPVDPSSPHFSAFTDWGQCLPNLKRPGSWNLEYEVVSDNIPGSRITVRLELGRGSAGVRFGQSYVDLEQP